MVIDSALNLPYTSECAITNMTVNRASAVVARPTSVTTGHPGEPIDVGLPGARIRSGRR